MYSNESEFGRLTAVRVGNQTADCKKESEAALRVISDRVEYQTDTLCKNESEAGLRVHSEQTGPETKRTHRLWNNNSVTDN